MRRNGAGLTRRPSANSSNTPCSTGSIAAKTSSCGGAVGAARLVAKAWRDLEIAVEPGDHQKLLELLRRLRQRIELPGVQPARDVIGPRAFRRIGGEDRRLELGEALLDHPPADRGDDLRAQHDVGMHPLAPQVEKAVGQPHVLGIVGVGVDRQRQRLGGRLHRQLGNRQLDLAGRQVRVDRVGRAGDDTTGDGDHAFQPQRVGRREQRRRHIDDALRHAVMVAQVDKQELAVVALAMHPARQPRALPGIAKAQRAASMGAIGVHRRQIPLAVKERGRRTDRPQMSSRAPAATIAQTRPSAEWGIPARRFSRYSPAQ
jgi:hypothetical protein